jgi:hypothetical protein
MLDKKSRNVQRHRVNATGAAQGNEGPKQNPKHETPKSIQQNPKPETTKSIQDLNHTVINA